MRVRKAYPENPCTLVLGSVKRYKVILCDPPWTYRNKKTGGSMSSGAASKYPTMDIADIKSLPISSIAGKNG